MLYAPHGPVWDRESADASEILAQLLAGARSIGREEKGIVLKLDPRADEQGAEQAVADQLAGAGVIRARHDLQAPTTRVVDLLDGAEHLMSTWVPDARTRVRRAAKEGVTTELDRVGDPAALDAFYGLLVETSTRQAFRIRSRSFLTDLAAALVRTDAWFLVLARFGDRPVAGIVGPRTGDRAFYLYAASTRDPAMERKRGGYAAMAALMRAHAEAGTRTLDLWGVAEPDDPAADASWAGFSSFKTRFGGVPVRHAGTFDLVIDPRWYRVRDWRERRAAERSAARAAFPTAVEPTDSLGESSDR